MESKRSSKNPSRPSTGKPPFGRKSSGLEEDKPDYEEKNNKNNYASDVDLINKNRPEASQKRQIKIDKKFGDDDDEPLPDESRHNTSNHNNSLTEKNYLDDSNSHLKRHEPDGPKDHKENSASQIKFRKEKENESKNKEPKENSPLKHPNSEHEDKRVSRFDPYIEEEKLQKKIDDKDYTHSQRLSLKENIQNESKINLY